jgi:O-antigen/teichoic acid export membrane protein
VLNNSPQVKRLRVHPIVRDLMVTAAASFTSFIAGLALISIFGRLLGVTLLGEYLLLRRVAAWLQPLTHLGLGVALPRYIAYSMKRSPGAQLEYFVAGVTCIVSFGAILGAVLCFARNPLGVLLFGSAQFARFTLPLFLLIFGGSMQAAVYGFYRGCLNMKRAGALQLCTAIVPITAAASLYRTRSVALIVSVIGCSVIGVAVAFAIPIVRELRWTAIRNLKTRALDLLKYGVSRIPGDLSTGGLLAIGPVCALHYMPVSRVSYLLVAVSMLTAASVSTEPLGLVFLSKISMMLAHDRLSDVQTYLSYLMSATVDMSLFLTIQLIVFADVLVRIWIGASLLEEISIIRIVLIGVPFYLFYTALRSAVDAGSIRPLNARNVMVSLIVLSILIVLGVKLVAREFLLHAIAVSLVLSFALLAYTTKMSLTKLYSVQVRWKESALPACCAVLLGGIGLAYHNTSNCLASRLAALELGFGLVFLGVCFCSGVRWVQLLRILVFRQTQTLETSGQLVRP